MSKRPVYDDKFRANAVLMLEAAGYPNRPGALTAVAKNLHIPHPTLSRWARNKNNAPPDDVVHEKKIDFISALRSEIAAAIQQMGVARPDADYRALTVGVGILIDKLQLLEGGPTERHEHSINDARDRLAGRIAGLAARTGPADDSGRINA